MRRRGHNAPVSDLNLSTPGAGPLTRGVKPALQVRSKKAYKRVTETDRHGAVGQFLACYPNTRSQCVLKVQSKLGIERRREDLYAKLEIQPQAARIKICRTDHTIFLIDAKQL